MIKNVNKIIERARELLSSSNDKSDSYKIGFVDGIKYASNNSSSCPNCNAKGYRTSLSINSYACKKCGTWWAYSE